MPDSARQMAADLLRGVLDEGRILSAPSGGEPATRARALRLAQETLRQLPRADLVLAPLLRKPPPAQIHALLRVCTTELLALGAPAHGVVNEAVTLTRASAPALSGLVNAVLRKASAFSDWAELPVPALPGWLRRRIKAAHGPDALLAIERAHLHGAALDLTLRPMSLSDRATLVAELGAQQLPGGSLRLNTGAQVSALPGFDQGLWWVQDAAAALPAQMLDARPGERVLDLCAAPGGKTLQLAAAGADVTAVDLSESRLARLHDNLRRTGLRASVICADALDWKPDAPFDAVLLDAPCSATGTIRRHPDLPYLRKPGDVASLVGLQERLLDRALEMLKPGGRLVYATCSLLVEEGEDRIAAALDRHPGLGLLPVAAAIGRPAPGGGWRTRPDDGVDGFFVAALRRA